MSSQVQMEHSQTLITYCHTENTSKFYIVEILQITLSDLNTTKLKITNILASTFHTES